MSNQTNPATGNVYQTINISLPTLSIHANNVRKTPATEESMQELMASISAHGLLVPLLVTPNGDNFEVVAGGRRLSAIQALAEQDNLPNHFDAGIPAVVLDAEADTQEISLTENVMREAMTPADAIDAFKAMFDNGHDITSISLRFGVSEVTVRKYVALGNVIPEILDKYRNNKVDIETVRKYASVESQERQKEIYDLCHDDDGDFNQFKINSILREKTMRADNRKVQCVGLEAYHKAGGTSTENLFSDNEEIIINNPEIVEKLFEEKVQAQIEHVLKKGWKWCEYSDHVYHGPHTKMKQISPNEAKRTPEEQALLNQYDEEWDAAEKISDFDGMDEAVRKGDELREKISERDTWDPEVQARAGMVVTLGVEGKLQLHAFVAPEDDPQKQEEIAEKQSKKPLYNKPNTEIMQRSRTQIAAAHLANDPEMAFNALTFDLAEKPFWNNRITLIKPEQAHMFKQDLPQSDSLETSKNALDTSWQKSEDITERFEAFCTLDHTEKMKWVAWSVANNYSISLNKLHSWNVPDIKEHVIARMNINWGQVWRPDEAYFNMLNRTHLLKIAALLMGQDWADTIANMKKTTIVTKLADVVKGETKPTSPEHAQIIASWSPPGLDPNEQPMVEPEAEDAPVAKTENENQEETTETEDEAQDQTESEDTTEAPEDTEQETESTDKPEQTAENDTPESANDNGAPAEDETEPTNIPSVLAS